jgi:hypothetical protein
MKDGFCVHAGYLQYENQLCVLGKVVNKTRQAKQRTRRQSNYELNGRQLKSDVLKKLEKCESMNYEIHDLIICKQDQALKEAIRNQQNCGASTHLAVSPSPDLSNLSNVVRAYRSIPPIFLKYKEMIRRMEKPQPKALSRHSTTASHVRVHLHELYDILRRYLRHRSSDSLEKVFDAINKLTGRIEIGLTGSIGPVFPKPMNHDEEDVDSLSQPIFISNI